MKGSFAALRLGELAPWLAGPQGIAYQQVMGEAEDADIRDLEDTVKMFSPFECAADALDLLGRHFQLDRYPGEADGTAPSSPGASDGTGYRARLCAAWETWAWAGTALAIEGQIRAFGVPDVRVYAAHELAFLPASPIGYDPNRSPPWYSAFIIVLGPNYGTTGIAPLRAPFVGGPQCTGGSTATRDQVKALARIALRWKATHGYAVGFVLRFHTTAVGGINTTAPFTPAAVPEYCFWNVGKLAQVNIYNGPFTPGGYEY